MNGELAASFTSSMANNILRVWSDYGGRYEVSTVQWFIRKVFLDSVSRLSAH
jgi:hypothetical protein